MKKKFEKIIVNALRNKKLKLTKQRVSLVTNIFKLGDRHITAESLHKEMFDLGIKLSLATVYNTLHDLTKVGMLRKVSVNSSQKYYDTNVVPHHHFYDKENNLLTDIPIDQINITAIPTPPKSKKISKVEVIISLENK
tara:strand:- start:117 stop:530 length:414 start_codon:yes stop_codon:yes gene_type:complete